jgi:hypothetical protein
LHLRCQPFDGLGVDGGHRPGIVIGVVLGVHAGRESFDLGVQRC